MTIKISVYIPVLNEEAKIEDALKTVAWADEIVVIDTGCTDQTIPIAQSYGAKIVTHTFTGFGKLRNAGIDACSHDWILSIDADERCTLELIQEIQALLAHVPQHDAYWIPRRNWFMNRWIKHSGWYPDYCQPKLFKRQALRYRDEDVVHEDWDVVGSIGYLHHDVLHFSYQHLSDIVRKIDNYAKLGADKLEAKGKSGGFFKGLSRGIWAFIRIYFIKMGFLDGKAGFMIALFNFETTFYRYVMRDWKKQKWNTPPSV